MYKTIYNTVTLVYDLLQISAAYSTSMLIIPNYHGHGTWVLDTQYVKQS